MHPTLQLRPALGLLLAAFVLLVATPSFASELTLTKASVKFSAKKGDAFVLSGTLQNLSLENVDAVRIDVGNFSETVPTAAFTAAKGKFVFKAPKGATGLVQVVIDTVKGTLGAKAKGLTLGNFPDPAPVRIVAGGFDACTMVALTAKRTKSGSFSALSFGKKGRQFACIIVDAPAAEPDAFFVNVPTGVRIRARVGSDPGLAATNVRLWRLDAALNPAAALGALVDDGNLGAGDDIAGDGVFSAFPSFTEAVPGSVHLGVSADVIVGGAPETVWSPAFALSVVAPLSSLQIDTIRTAQETARSLWDQYRAELGDSLKARKKAAKAIKALDGVSDAGVSSDNLTIWIEYDGGPSGVVLSPEPATGDAPAAPHAALAAEAPTAAVRAAASATDAKDIGNNRVLFWEPFADSYPEYGSFHSKLKPMFDASVCPVFQLSTIKDTACTVASVKQFAGYGTIIITGHGGVKKGDVIFVTRQKLTWSEWWNSAPTDSRLIIASVDGTEYLAITPAFIASQQYPQSLVFNTACNGLDNPSMKAAFLGSGAATYYAYRGQGVYTFSLGLAEQVFQALVAGQKKTGEAHAALAATKAPVVPIVLKGGGVFDISEEGRDFAYTGRFRNGDFETGDLSAWSREGDAQVVTSLGNLNPKSGTYSGLVSTGLGFATQSGTIYQSFCLPEKATSLEFDWAFSSEEFKEYCGSTFQDTFRVAVTDDADVHDLQTTTVDAVCGEVVPSSITLDRSGGSCEPTPDVGVGTGGNDCKVWTTGWKHQSISLAALVASNANEGVTLTFSATDVGDSSYDTAVLIDNIEIKTTP